MAVVRTSGDARDQWVMYAEAHNCTVAALLETISDQLDGDTIDLREATALAQTLTVERRKRR